MILHLDIEHSDRYEIAAALEGITNDIEDDRYEGEVRDAFGRYMGRWEITDEKEQESFK